MKSKKQIEEVLIAKKEYEKTACYYIGCIGHERNKAELRLRSAKQKYHSLANLLKMKGGIKW